VLRAALAAAIASPTVCCSKYVTSWKHRHVCRLVRTTRDRLAPALRALATAKPWKFRIRTASGFMAEVRKVGRTMSAWHTSCGYLGIFGREPTRSLKGREPMRSRPILSTVVGSLFAAACLTAATPSLSADEEAAKALLKENDCFKCHAIDKTKKGPSYKKIAAKYREKGKEADAEAKMIKHMTTSPKVKLEDGTEEEHKIIDTKDQAQLKNVVQWILSL
jgi:cytochrome c